MTIKHPSPEPIRRIITLLTDFGASDHFVAAMKGVILSRASAATIVDITHEIHPQDIHGAAFQLLCVYKSFPAGTVHVAVVDPGVGSSRRAIAVEMAGQYFVGPDNGIFSYILDRELDVRAVELTNRAYFADEVSQTFHGRDVFAPVGAALGSGVGLAELGLVIRDLVKLERIDPITRPGGMMEALILHIDRFGNCITSLRRDHLDSGPEEITQIEVGDRTIKTVRTHYAELVPSDDPIFAVFGSAGFLEIVARNTSAAEALRTTRGARVFIRRSK